MERWSVEGQDTGSGVEGQDTGSGVSTNGDHSRRTAAIRFYLLSSRQFSAHPKSSHACIDKRTARAAGNTRYRYNKIGPLDHKMADNCVSLARKRPVITRTTAETDFNHERRRQRSVREARHTQSLVLKQTVQTFAWGALSSRSSADSDIK